MKFKEFLIGTPKEVAASQTLSKLKSKPHLNVQERARLEEAMFHSRRLFLKRGVVAVGSAALLAGGGGLLWKVLENTTDELESGEKYTLGEKIKSWQLPDGTSMRTVIPELEEAGNVFQKNSLEEFMPTATYPIVVKYLDRGSVVGQLTLTTNFSEDKSVRVINEAPGISTFNMPLLTALKPEILLLKSMKGTAAELVVAAKEAMQIVEFNEYCRFYRLVLEGRGSKFTLVKPEGVNISEDLINISIAMFQSQTQKQKEGLAWFDELVDRGSFIRMGAIAYANWKVNYLHRESSLVTEEFIKSGDTAAGLLQQEGIIIQSGRTFRYTRGTAPQIGSPEFQELFSKATGFAPK